MKITKKEFLDILKDKNAWPEVVKWVKENKAETFIEIWNSCEQADWMLWFLARMVDQKEWPSRKTVVLCACDCAETSLRFVPEDEDRPKKAIEIARMWAEGKTSKIECEKAASASFDAADDVYIASFSFSGVNAIAYAADVAAAAYAAAYAAEAVFDVVSSLTAVSFVADAAGHAAFYASNVSFDAKKEALRNMADIVRKRVTFEKE
jgi:hypothetical protein